MLRNVFDLITCVARVKPELDLSRRHAGDTMILESPLGCVVRRESSFRAVRVQFKEGGDAYRLQIK